jgi:hypothetical protein
VQAPKRAKPSSARPVPSTLASAEPAKAISCRVLEVIENGQPVQPAIGRVTFEWARRLCGNQPSAAGKPYRLSESGISVKCVCD